MAKISLLVGVAALVSMTVSASAGVNKTWVSGTGVDSGTCTFTAPCATFNYAIGQANAGGEVDVKDSGGYGTFTINKAISIEVAPGVLATINVPYNTAGITVNMPVNATASIRGLTINGHDLGYGFGIQVTQGANLSVSHCYIRNLNNGVYFLSTNNTLIVNFIQNEMTGNNTAIRNTAGVTIYMSGNTIFAGQHIVNGANVFSYGDNMTYGNREGSVAYQTVSKY